MANKNLNKAKEAKKDEFYTQLEDINNELRHYREHFRGKTVLCNCDDPRVSNFALRIFGCARQSLQARLASLLSLARKFNRQNNDDLLLAIQTAGVVRGRNGFRKDKGGEKLDETEENLLEHRTDGTDAFDTLYIGCEKFPQSNALSAVCGNGVF